MTVRSSSPPSFTSDLSNPIPCPSSDRRGWAVGCLAGLPLSARSASIYSCAAAILQPAMTEAETLPSPARIVLLALHMRATELGKTFTPAVAISLPS